MKKKHASKSAFFNRRILISFAFCSIGLLLALVAFALYPGGKALAQGQRPNQTPEEAQRLAEGIKPLVNRSTEGLVEVTRPDGSVSMNLQGRFQNVAVARREANGTISQSCVDNVDAAAAFFGINPQLLDPTRPAPAFQNQTGPNQSDQH
jgi:hypothetical protein